MKIWTAAALLIVVLAGCSSGHNKHHIKHQSNFELTRSTSIQVLPLSTPKLVFKGKLSKETEEVQGTMMYPGDAGIAGLIVGIATHAAIESGRQASAANAAQAEADKTLEAFKPSIDQLGSDTALEALLSTNQRLVGDLADQAAEYSVELRPVYVLTQDHDLLSVESAVVVRKISPARPVVYQNMVRVTRSMPDGLSSAPVDEQTKLLSRISHQLLQEALQLALRDAEQSAADVKPKMQTFRFAEGDKYNYERGALIEIGCEQVAIRTLRKWILALPREHFVGLQDEPINECSESDNVKQVSASPSYTADG